MRKTEWENEETLCCAQKSLFAVSGEAYAPERRGYEILFLLTGRAVLFVNGREVPVSENEMLLFTPAVRYRAAFASSDAEAVSLRFSSRLAQAAVPGSLPVLFKGDKENGVFSAAFTRKNNVQALLTAALRETELPQTAVGAAALAVLLPAVKNELFRDPEALTDKGVKEKMSFIIRRVDADSAVCDEKELAAACGLSYSYFSRSFKAAMGMSFREYVNFRRINEAKRLLAETDDDIAAMARSLGFSSPSHFINVFGELTGTSPKQFRLSLRNAAAK